MSVGAGNVSLRSSLLEEEEKWKSSANEIANRGVFNSNSGLFPENYTTYNNIDIDGGLGNICNINSGFAQNAQFSNSGFCGMQTSKVQCKNGNGFGSSIFNPLGLFTTPHPHYMMTSNTNDIISKPQLGTNYYGFHDSALPAGNPSNTSAIMINDKCNKSAGEDPMQNNYWTTIAPSPALADYSFPATHQPVSAALLTPDHGPIPCPTPPESPMFMDSHPFQPPTDASVVSQASLDHEDNCSKPVVRHGGARFLRGIGTVGSALSTVAGYVNHGLLLGIPFHIADRAMKESKQLYSKWWDQEVGKKRKSSVQGERETGELEVGHPVGKKRRLNSRGSAALRVGSTLTKSLTKNYDDELIETCSIGHDRSISSSRSPKLVVDCSIIKPRRSLQKPNQEDTIIRRTTLGNCHDAYNDIAGMYDFGETNESHHRRRICGITEQMTSQSLGISNSRELYNAGYDAFNDIGGMYDFEVVSESTNSGKKSGYKVDTDKSLVSTVNRSAAASNQSTNIATAGPWRNLNGTMQVIGELIKERNRQSEENELFQMITSPRDWVKKSIRSELIDALGSGKGDVHDKRFLSVLEILSNFYKTSGRDARVSPWSGNSSFDGGKYGYNGGETGGPTASDFFEGSWVNMSRPNYIECLGENGDNDFMYTLGRMSFDMFQPSNLICSVQSTHTTIKIIGEREELPAFVPKSLKEEVASLCDLDNHTAKRPLLRSYDIAISLTIEPPSSVGQPETPGTPTPSKRMRAVMSVKGYVLPDRDIPNRLSVWFTHGQLAPAKLASNDENEIIDMEDSVFNQAHSRQGDAQWDGYGGFEEWSAMFAKGKWRKTMGQRARAMAAKLLLGAELPSKMDEDGRMKYVLHRPVGGHGKVYVDVLYLDEDILVMRGHHGTIYAMARSCVSQRYVCRKSSNIG